MRNNKILCCLWLISGLVQANFLTERYRGWFWFETKPKVEEKVIEITPQAAQVEIETFAQELADLKHVMLARPTVENIYAYREKERIMWQKALQLHENWELTNLKYPEQRDLINAPINVHAVKAKRELESQSQVAQIHEFAKNYDLVLLFSPNCKYCDLLTPILQEFVTQYGFKLEAVNAIDDSPHPIFTTKNNRELIRLLKISAFPTVIAVSHDTKQAFELIRGLVSFSELSEYSLLAIKQLALEKGA